MLLLDVERIAPCMPRRHLDQLRTAPRFTGNVKVKLVPVSLSYKGTGRFTERDEEGRRVAFMAQGQDSRGAGGASARVTAVLHTARDGEATLVKVVADIDIAGKAAQFGRGMIADVSGKLAKQFADCLATTIAASRPPLRRRLRPHRLPRPVPRRVPGSTAAPAPTRPTLTPLFAEPSPAVVPEPPVYAPPTPSQARPPSTHPLAMQEPPEGYAPLRGPLQRRRRPKPEIKLESAYRVLARAHTG
jgi:carbon monoxide dehydrogenase subunit G